MKLTFSHKRKKYFVKNNKVYDDKNKIAIICSPDYNSPGYSENRTDPFMVKSIIMNDGFYVVPKTKQTLQIRFVPENMEYTIIDKNGCENIILKSEIDFRFP